MIVFMCGWPTLSTVVGEFSKDSSAYEAGMASGDKIISINSKKIKYWDEIKPIITESKGGVVTVSVLRGNEEKTFNIHPQISKVVNIFNEEQTDYLIGISPAGELITEKRNPFGVI